MVTGFLDYGSSGFSSVFLVVGPSVPNTNFSVLSKQDVRQPRMHCALLNPHTILVNFSWTHAIQTRVEGALQGDKR